MTDKKAHPLHRAWAAGVFESRNQWPKTGYVMRIESMDGAMIRRFGEIVQVGTVDIGHRKTFDMTIFRTFNMDDTRELLLLLSPFFTGARLKKATDMIGRIERNATWQKKYPAKAASCVISPAPNVGAETTEDSTQAAGPSASDAE